MFGVMKLMRTGQEYYDTIIQHDCNSTPCPLSFLIIITEKFGPPGPYELKANKYLCRDSQSSLSRINSQITHTIDLRHSNSVGVKNRTFLNRTFLNLACATSSVRFSDPWTEFVRNPYWAGVRFQNKVRRKRSSSKLIH